MRLGWVDYSREEKNKITAILRLLGTQGAVDELGIGTVRDYFSNQLFPGITVLQTRAKYFVLIPYLFADAARQKYARRGEVLAWINRQEDALVKNLVRASPDELGIIGKRSYRRGETVKQKPSTIYWNGLRATMILRYPDFSIMDACEMTYAQSRRSAEIALKAESGDTKGDDIDMLYDGRLLFEPIHPGYDYKNECSIPLMHHEAVYLRDRFTLSPGTKDSLTAFLLQDRVAWKSVHESAAFDTTALPEGLRQNCELAKSFADFIYGAHLLYNLVFSQGSDEEVEERFGLWLENEYDPIDLDLIVEISGCPRHTALFLRTFDQCIADRDIGAARKVVIDRERFMKQDRAKLNKPEEFIYDPSARVHDYKLDYRFNTAITIIQDIYQGIGDFLEG